MTTEVDHSHTAARARLDDAVRAYLESAVLDGRAPEGRIVVGWMMGVAVTGLDDDGDEVDGMFREHAPAMNGYLLRGLAETTAELYAEDVNPD